MKSVLEPVTLWQKIKLGFKLWSIHCGYCHGKLGFDHRHNVGYCIDCHRLFPEIRFKNSNVTDMGSDYNG